MSSNLRFLLKEPSPQPSEPFLFYCENIFDSIKNPVIKCCPQWNHKNLLNFLASFVKKKLNSTHDALRNARTFPLASSFSPPFKSHHPWTGIILLSGKDFFLQPFISCQKIKWITSQIMRLISFLPPLTVNVANSYSATVKPALLWAVTRNMYLREEKKRLSIKNQFSLVAVTENGKKN